MHVTAMSDLDVHYSEHWNGLCQRIRASPDVSFAVLYLPSPVRFLMTIPVDPLSSINYRDEGPSSLALLFSPCLYRVVCETSLQL